MLTLLLRLAGPLQSWGTTSAFRDRATEREPSKSGVVGLLAAALGRERSEPIADLAALEMGVRVDHEGTLLRDYHTVGGTHWKERRYARDDAQRYGVAEFDGKVTNNAVLTQRHYLADADFLVGLAAATADQEELLHVVDRALVAPAWPLALGRKACVPARPVRLPDALPLGPGLRAEPLRAALLAYPWPPKKSLLRFVFDDPTSQSGIMRRDVPVAFDTLNRRYQTRFITIEDLPRPANVPDDLTCQRRT